MVITATVLEARVITLTSAHQFSTGNWLRISSRAMSPNIRSSSCSRLNDCTTITFDSASCAVPASAELCPSTRRCPASVLRTTIEVTVRNRQTSTISTSASRQFRNRVSGSSTTTDSTVESWSRKNTSQVPNNASVPVSMVLITRPECASPWNDSGSASTWRKYLLIASIRWRCARRSV